MNIRENIHRTIEMHRAHITEELLVNPSLKPFHWIQEGNQEGKKTKLSVCVSVCVCVCVNEIPTLIFYVCMLSDVPPLIWMPLIDGRH
jgi:hypothetical protein